VYKKYKKRANLSFAGKEKNKTSKKQTDKKTVAISSTEGIAQLIFFSFPTYYLNVLIHTR